MKKYPIDILKELHKKRDAMMKEEVDLLKSILETLPKEDGRKYYGDLDSFCIDWRYSHDEIDQWQWVVFKDAHGNEIEISFDEFDDCEERKGARILAKKHMTAVDLARNRLYRVISSYESCRDIQRRADRIKDDLEYSSDMMNRLGFPKSISDIEK